MFKPTHHGLCLAVTLAAGLASACATTPPPAAARAALQPEMTPALSGQGFTADDPTVTDPDHYVTILENEHVRVLRYHDSPGAKTHQHQHPDSTLYAIGAFRRRLIFPDGTTKEREFHAGDVMWVPAQTHIGENIGDSDTEVLLVEMK